MSKMRRQKLSDAAAICGGLLASNSRDEAVWYLKCRALTAEQYVDESEMEEEGVAEILLDSNATADMPRPGTSLNRPMTRAGGLEQGMRPMTSSGRPVTGFLRPGTSSRPMTGQQMDVSTAMRGPRPGTSRPATALGREVRLGTASLDSGGGAAFVDTDRLDLKRMAKRGALAAALVEYLLYVERNPRKALELAAEATAAADFKDWWWKARLGRCYHKLGMYRDAEKQLKSSLKDQDMLLTHLELVKVYQRLDLPNTALDLLARAAVRHDGDARLALASARLHEALSAAEAAGAAYKTALALDPTNVEATASLAVNYFYADQPEVALRYYQRLLQCGASGGAVWNNLGLCCFYGGQYDMALGCLDRALTAAGDDIIGDVWYNIAQVAIGMGDVGMAYQALRVASTVDTNHAESFCNLGVLEMRKQNNDSARVNLLRAQTLGPWLFEAFYNGALLDYRTGNFQEAYRQCQRALELFPEHSECKELMDTLAALFAAM
ncbi:hypothetical protein JKP88DRAFT_259616 [Tribonema minus]|uniref:Tetratricopeptide repeat protein 8 n=1 Tax=Tribonema minus TaxID=303371 RepID=A0A836CMW3_9STRA|nr:hypothetical protein JKP88DRAFT_259616 [Tribonema minus]